MLCYFDSKYCASDFKSLEDQFYEQRMVVFQHCRPSATGWLKQGEEGGVSPTPIPLWCTIIAVSSHPLFWFLFLLIRVTLLFFTGAFRFLKQPSRFRNVFNKQNVVLDCRTTDPLSKSTLYHQGKAVSTSSGSSISKNGSIYVIQSLQIKQIGMYRCEALSSSGQKIFWQTILLYILCKFENY